jgi:hypothetical protein
MSSFTSKLNSQQGGLRRQKAYFAKPGLGPNSHLPVTADKSPCVRGYISACRSATHSACYNARVQ